MPLLRLSLPEIFFVTCAPGGVVFCLCLLMACAFNGAPAYAQVPSEENPSRRRESFTEPGQITDAEAQSVAEEKKRGR